MYVIGMNEEFGPAIAVNAIWDYNSPDRNPEPEACLRLHLCEDAGKGNFYTVDADALPETEAAVGYKEYAKGNPFKDVTTGQWLSSVLRDTSVDYARFDAAHTRVGAGTRTPLHELRITPRVTQPEVHS